MQVQIIEKTDMEVVIKSRIHRRQLFKIELDRLLILLMVDLVWVIKTSVMFYHNLHNVPVTHLQYPQHLAMVQHLVLVSLNLTQLLGFFI